MRSYICYIIFNFFINIKVSLNPIKKWAKDLNRPFSKEDIQRAQKHMKGCSASLAIKSCKLKPQ